MIVPDDTHLCGLQYRESGYKLNRSLSLSSFRQTFEKAPCDPDATH